ncbi:MAG: protein jag [Clostridiales bacterium]|jgi:spoIIIJ-associated protein|nr:protein jag [Clostridiales bacterium]
MKFIEITGKNIDDAIEKGLKELKLEADKVEVEVLEHGSKGIFGLGSKPAKVKLTVKHDYTTVAKIFLKDILDKMDIQSEINIIEEADIIRINLEGPDMGILIGYRGETLDALQYLLSLVINKENKDNDYKKVILDTEGYRKKREETLIRLANKLAYKVNKYNKSITLEPMNPYERRIIHAALQSHPHVTTHSQGEEPYRKVVIELKG